MIKTIIILLITAMVCNNIDVYNEPEFTPPDVYEIN
jgi:hypothetical protein